MPIRRTRSVTPRTPDTLRSPLLTLALAGAVICGGVLLFVRFAHWAGAHPVPAVLLALLALPVLYTLFRAMPRVRELRRAARAGMAPPAEETITDPDPAPQILLHAPTDARDGLTAVLPPPVPDFAALDPDGFEAAVAELCERDGCREVEVVGGAGDWAPTSSRPRRTGGASSCSASSTDQTTRWAPRTSSASAAPAGRSTARSWPPW